VPAAAAAPIQLTPLSSPVQLLLGALVFGAVYLLVAWKAGMFSAAHAQILHNAIARLRNR
jgi:hypothetical protein